MNIISLIASIQAPTGLWEKLINWFHGGIGNFGWTIFLLVVTIKLVSSPLDFWTKLDQKKQSLIKQKCAPHVAKIRKKFGADKQRAELQIRSLHKREGMKTGVSGCLATILNLVIFFSFFGALRTCSAYQAINQYEILLSTYNTTSVNLFVSKNEEITDYSIINEETATVFVNDYFKGMSLEQTNEKNPTVEETRLVELYNQNALFFDGVTEYSITNTEEAIKFVNDYFAGKELVEQAKTEPTEAETALMNIYQKYSTLFDGKTKEEATTFVTEIFNGKKLSEERALINLYQKYTELVNDIQNQTNQAVVDKWDEIKSSWLWIENIWVADAPVSPFQTYEDFVKITNNGGKTYSEYVSQNIDETLFTSISNIVNNLGERQNNGFLILAIIVAVITFLSQHLTERHNKIKNKQAKTAVDFSMQESLEVTMKMMKFIMPIIMMVFVLTNTASFGIYILASTIASIGLGELLNLIINKITHIMQLEVEGVLEKETQRLIKKGKIQEKK